MRQHYLSHPDRSQLIRVRVWAVVAIWCGTAAGFRIPEPTPPDTCDIPMPTPWEIHLISTNINRVANSSVLRYLDLARLLREATGNPYPALNVDAFGEVPNSSWFTNRNARERMSLPEIVQGPNAGSGPDTSGEWRIFRAKNEGASLGFHIIDSRDNRYLIKLDTRWNRELSSGAEVIAAKILYAAGYNVPQNNITVFDPAKVKLREGEIAFEDELGRERPMTYRDLDTIFDLAYVRPDGLVRGMASKYIEGVPLGGWRYRGTRPDDPNDFIPHEHRREIRGLRVISAWLNHYDTNNGNTFDTYTTVEGKSYVKHYMIDFGGTLGASMEGPMPRTYGHQYFFDPHIAMLKILTLGLYHPLYERWDTIPYPAAGAWEARSYHPGRFRFLYPNLAFDNLNRRDGYWAARIVMSFTDEQLRAVAREGKYSDPAVAPYIAKVLIERRDKTGRHYYSRVNPLDNFALNGLDNGNYELCFDDMAVEGGLARAENTTYVYSVAAECDCPRTDQPLVEGTCIPVRWADIPSHLSGVLVVAIQTLRKGERPSPYLRVYLRRSAEGELELVGVER